MITLKFCRCPWWLLFIAANFSNQGQRHFYFSKQKETNGDIRTKAMDHFKEVGNNREVSVLI